MNDMRVMPLVMVGETEKALKCLAPGSTSPFWLAKSEIKELGGGQFEIPAWLMLRHRQLCGDEAFEIHKARRKTAERERRTEQQRPAIEGHDLP